MKVQFASDLHLEFRENEAFVSKAPFKAVGEVFVLAGDTFLLNDIAIFQRNPFFDWCADNFRETFLIPGNHEYYYDDIATYPPSWEIQLRDNVTICENKMKSVDDTDFILTTLWSHIPNSHQQALSFGLNDFRLIRNGEKPLTCKDFNNLHNRDLDFLLDAAKRNNAKKKVVITHHVPSRLLVAPEYANSILESGFMVDLTNYIASSGVDLWIYGHSHRNINRIIGNTLVVSNQIGYVRNGEHESFSGEMMIDL